MAKALSKLFFRLSQSFDLTLELPVGRRSVRMRCTNARELRRAYTLFTKEPMTVSLLSDEVHEGDVVWDIGANVGLYTLVAARAVGSNGKVVAFEPMAANFSRLLDNVALNRFNERVSLISTPLSNVTGVTRLYYDDPTAGATGAQINAPIGVSDTAFVPSLVEIKSTLTADELLQGDFIPRPHVVKLDVDGHEPAILKGMADTLCHPEFRPRIVIVEVNPGDGEEISAVMRSYGYQLDRREPTGPSKKRLNQGTDYNQLTYNAAFRPI
ncbi:FkbM family methyltransferase [Pseudaminobacter sp. 19-2017]|uniref:FkbM family methyltransferase n=1 Tax=Pseudaminobacter soli (ex Zhang et al. 2022) TaxID=2831468 RepID=A0A942I445_9HYPH|nr:FkbM family methyltransferase [Pseudaminobacter soli]MBS3652292.1 FkbM family methyltransferase [Pseudaminobacter soli]